MSDTNRYWYATDEDGHCSRCGVAWTDDELNGDVTHECPEGFWKQSPPPHAPAPPSGEEEARAWYAKLVGCKPEEVTIGHILAAYAAHREQQQKERDARIAEKTAKAWDEDRHGRIARAIREQQ